MEAEPLTWRSTGQGSSHTPPVHLTCSCEYRKLMFLVYLLGYISVSIDHIASINQMLQYLLGFFQREHVFPAKTYKHWILWDNRHSRLE